MFQGKVREFFNISNIKEMVQVTVKPRANYAREILFLMTLSSIVMSLLGGDGGITFLYFRAKFGWTLTKFTLYSSGMSVVSFIGNILGTFFLHKYLAVTESVLIFMSLLTTLDGHLIQGLAKNDNHLYVGKTYTVRTTWLKFSYKGYREQK